MTSHIRLEAVAEEDEERHYSFGIGKPSGCFRRKKGEGLSPERFSLAVYADIRRDLGELAWNTQYQQRPAPPGGTLVKTEWFSRYGRGATPTFDRTLQSWDTASKIGASRDYSVCTTWGQHGEDIYLLDVLRRQYEFPELRKQVEVQAQAWGANVVVIEDKGSGTQLLQDLQATAYYRFQPALPTQGKITRMSNQTAVIEAGRVFIPEQALWLDEYLKELSTFPNSRYADQVDSTPQALAFMRPPIDRCEAAECMN